MLICIDFDGVIADTSDAKRQWLSKNCGLNIPGGSFSRTQLRQLMSETTYHRMQNEVGFKDTLLAPPLPGCKEIIGALATRADLHILSSRVPEKLIWAQEWLRVNGMYKDFRGVHSTAEISKLDLASLLGAMWLIDNDKRHLSESASEIRMIWFTDKGSVSTGREICAHSWKEVLHALFYLGKGVSDGLSVLHSKV